MGHNYNFSESWLARRNLKIKLLQFSSIFLSFFDKVFSIFLSRFATSLSCMLICYLCFLHWLQEKFIELFSNDAYDSAREDQKSFVGYKHLGKTSFL